MGSLGSRWQTSEQVTSELRCEQVLGGQGAFRQRKEQYQAWGWVQQAMLKDQKASQHGWCDVRQSERSKPDMVRSLSLFSVPWEAYESVSVLKRPFRLLWEDTFLEARRNTRRRPLQSFTMDNGGLVCGWQCLGWRHVGRLRIYFGGRTFRMRWQIKYEKNLKGKQWSLVGFWIDQPGSWLWQLLAYVLSSAANTPFRTVLCDAKTGPL